MIRSVAFSLLALSSTAFAGNQCAKPVCTIYLEHSSIYGWDYLVLQSGDQEINRITVGEDGNIDKKLLAAAQAKVRKQAKQIQDSGACATVIDDTAE